MPGRWHLDSDRRRRWITDEPWRREPSCRDCSAGAGHRFGATEVAEDPCSRARGSPGNSRIRRLGCERTPVFEEASEAWPRRRRQIRSSTCVHTEYSMLDGAAWYPTSSKVWMGITRLLAMTDHGNVFGAYEFYKQARSTGSSRSSGWRRTSPPEAGSTSMRDLGRWRRGRRVRQRRLPCT